MKQWIHRSIRFGILAFALAVPLSARADTDFSVDPRATYLRVNTDNALNAAPIDLFAIGITPGDTISLTRLGDYARGNPPFDSDIYMDLSGVFSSSNVLGPAGDLHRVTGAIDAGTDLFTPPTFSGSLPTDIAEDFQISNITGTSSSITIDVPTGARYLFVGPFDVYFQDNFDPNANFGVRIGLISNAVPEASSATALLLGIVCLAGTSLKYRRRSR